MGVDSHLAKVEYEGKGVRASRSQLGLPRLLDYNFGCSSPCRLRYSHLLPTTLPTITRSYKLATTLCTLLLSSPSSVATFTN